jgi:hypothetical protein
VEKLWKILEDTSSDDIVSWDEKGTQFCIKNRVVFAEKILPQYFAHNKFSSFTRQLSYFKFVRHQLSFPGKGGQQQAPYFSHPSFLRSDYQSAIQIRSTYKNKPKEPKSKRSAHPPNVQPYRTNQSSLKRQRVEPKHEPLPSSPLNKPGSIDPKSDPQSVYLSTLSSLAVINQCLQRRQSEQQQQSEQRKLPSMLPVKQHTQEQHQLLATMSTLMPPVNAMPPKIPPLATLTRGYSFSSTGAIEPPYHLLEPPQLSLSAVMGDLQQQTAVSGGPVNVRTTAVGEFRAQACTADLQKLSNQPQVQQHIHIHTQHIYPASLISCASH